MVEVGHVFDPDLDLVSVTHVSPGCLPDDRLAPPSVTTQKKKKSIIWAEKNEGNKLQAGQGEQMAVTDHPLCTIQ